MALLVRPGTAVHLWSDGHHLALACESRGPGKSGSRCPCDQPQADSSRVVIQAHTTVTPGGWGRGESHVLALVEISAPRRSAHFQVLAEVQGSGSAVAVYRVLKSCTAAPVGVGSGDRLGGRSFVKNGGGGRSRRTPLCVLRSRPRIQGAVRVKPRESRRLGSARVRMFARRGVVTGSGAPLQ